MSPDRRAITSRANLGTHIPKALDPTGSTVVGVRIPNPILAELDKRRGDRSRSDYLRELIARELTASPA